MRTDRLASHATTILESLPDALLIVDGHGDIQFTNDQVETVFGYQRGELIGRPIEVLIPEPRRGAHREHRARYMASPQMVPMGCGTARRAALKKDGALVPVEVSLSPIHSDEGLLVVCTARDVSERERSLRDTEMHLAVERIIASILRASLASKSLDELLALALEELFSIPWIALQSKGAVFLLGDSPDALAMKAQRGLNESVRARCSTVSPGACLCGLAAATQQAVFADRLDERHATRYDGIVEHGHYCVPIMSHGRLHGVMTLYLDEGHRWKAEEEHFLRSVADVLAGAIVRLQLADELRDSEERFALAVAGTDAGIWDWDPQGDRIFFSPRWKSMLGYGDHELKDHYLEWERRIHPDDRADALRTLEEYLAGKRETYEIEHRLLHRNGTYRWILSRGAAVRDADGRPYRMVGSHLDITRRKEAEETVRMNTAKLIAAQRIQERILPRASPIIEGFDIAGRLYPAEFAAGDHFDYLPMEQGALGVMVADVSGHGVDSALIMGSVHAYLRLLTLSHGDVASILRRANSLLSREIEPGRYVTVFLGRLNPSAMSFSYVSAGHPTAYLLDTRGSVKAALDSTCIPLGIMADASIPEARTVALEPGDILVCVTDGLIEAESATGIPFGSDRLLHVVARHRHERASRIIDGVWAAIGEFSERSTFSDDATAIVIKARQAP